LEILTYTEIDKIMNIYEVYYTNNYKELSKNNWVLIDIIPESRFNLSLESANDASSNKSRISVRKRDNTGKILSYNIYKNTLVSSTVGDLIPPTIIYPKNNSNYNNTIYISYDDDSLIGTPSEKGYYCTFYSNSSIGIEWTQIGDPIPVGKGFIYWDVSNLKSSSNYEIKSYIEDNKGRKSKEIFITDISILNNGRFILDTTPPEGTVSIKNNQIYTNTRDIILSILAEDNLTDIKKIIITEKNLTTNESRDIEYPYSEIKNIRLEDEDGIKNIEVSFYDHAGNTLSQSVFYYARNFVEFSDNFVEFVYDSNGDVYSIVNGSENSNLYKNQTQIVSVARSLTSICNYQSSIYVSSFDNDGSYLERLSNSGLTKILTFDIYGGDDRNIISVMASDKENIYIGMESGYFYSFNGNSVVLENIFEKSISSIKIINNIVYIGLDNDDSYYLYVNNNFIEVKI
jgi:hypothetical protein